jgi:hypothetical protein
MGSYSARDTCRVARAAGAGHPAAGSARPARACFDADRSERAERHAGTVAPFMMPRRLMTGRISWHPFETAKIPEINFRALLTEGTSKLTLV